MTGVQAAKGQLTLLPLVQAIFQRFSFPQNHLLVPAASRQEKLEHLLQSNSSLSGVQRCLKLVDPFFTELFTGDMEVRQVLESF